MRLISTRLLATVDPLRSPVLRRAVASFWLAVFLSALTLDRAVAATAELEAASATAVGDEVEKLLVAGKIAEAESKVLPALDQATAALGEKHLATIDLIALLAAVRQQQGRHQESLDLREKEISLSTAVSGPLSQNTLSAMNTRASSLVNLGRHVDAVTAYTKTLELQQQLLGPTHRDVSETVSNLASAQLRSGQQAEALRNFERGYQLRLAAFGPTDNTTLSGLGNYANALLTVGRADEAEPLAAKAWLLRKAAHGEEHFQTSIARNIYAGVLTALGRFREAAEHHSQAAAAHSRALGDTHPVSLRLRATAALARFRLGEIGEAVEVLGALLRDIDAALGALHPHALALRHDLATAHASLGDWQAALPLFVSAHEGLVATSKATHADALRSRFAVAVAYSATGDTARARDVLQAMTLLLDEGRIESLSLGPTAARSWQRAFVGVYGKLIEIEIKAGHNVVAFDLLERVKARVLLDQVSAQNAARNGDLPAADASRLESETQAVASLSARLELSKVGLEREQLSLKLTEVVGQLSAFREQLSASHPRYQLLTSTRPASVSDATLLADDAAFISYKVDPGSRVQAAVLDSSGVVQWYSLGTVPDLSPMIAALRLMTSQPKSKRDLYLDDAGRTVRIVRWNDAGQTRWRTVTGALECVAEEPATAPVGDITAINTSFVLATTLAQALEPNCIPQGAVIENRTRGLRDITAALSARLLLPMSARLSSKRHWIISPEASLWAVPWDQLSWRGKPLAATVAVSLSHSFSVYKIIRERLGRRDVRQTQRQELLAFGDPIYPRMDAPSSYASSRQALLRSPFRAAFDATDANQSLRMIRWPRLPFSRLEVQAVARQFDADKVRLMLGDAATKQQLRALNASGHLSHYKYLLFSTHGYFDPTVPEHSSIVLGGGGADAQFDGFVSLNEWLGMRLDSDLTVLSACNTAMGSITGADGLVGQSYALLIAGNANTIATLWPVADRETAHFVEQVFRHIKSGLSHGEALAKTKREFLRNFNPKLRDPRYWAAFVLFGG